MRFEIEDPLHGKMSFEEPVFFQLINSKLMNRIRDVDMGAYSRGFYPGSWFSRFEHSLGVSYLLRIAGASISEQIHGLLHDINHTAFSHAIDYVVKEGTEATQSYQDDTFLDFVMSSCIPNILEKNGFNTEYIVDSNNFPLEERPLPELCADRLDYAMRSLYHYQLMDISEIKDMIASLKNDQTRWIFINREAASRFASAFAKLNSNIFSSFKAGVMYRSIGDCVGYALRKNVISHADLLTTDTAVSDKLSSAAKSDYELHKFWERMNGRIHAVPCDDDDAIEVECKSRVVDPLFLENNNQIRRLSDVDDGWKSFVVDEMKPKRYRFKYVTSPSPVMHL